MSTQASMSPRLKASTNRRPTVTKCCEECIYAWTLRAAADSASNARAASAGDGYARTRRRRPSSFMSTIQDWRCSRGCASESASWKQMIMRTWSAGGPEASGRNLGAREALPVGLQHSADGLAPVVRDGTVPFDLWIEEALACIEVVAVERLQELQ